MQKQFIIVAILLVILMGGTLISFGEFSARDTTEIQNESPLIKDPLSGNNDANVSQIKQIEILRAGETQLRAFQADGEWLASHLSVDVPYPLQKAPLVELVRALVNAQIVEYKSAKPENHERLGLQDPSPQNKETSLVRFTTYDNKHIELLIGNSATIQEGQFVRYKNDNQMLLIDQPINVPESNVAWLEQSLFDLQVEDVVEVTYAGVVLSEEQSEEKREKLNQEQSEKPITNENIETWRIVRASTADTIASNSATFTLSDMAESESLNQKTVLNNYIVSIADLSFSDVSPLSSVDSSSMQKVLELKVKTRQGQEHLISVSMDNGVYRVNFVGQGEYIRLNEWMYTVPTFQIEALIKERAAFVTNASLE